MCINIMKYPDIILSANPYNPCIHHILVNLGSWELYYERPRGDFGKEQTQQHGFLPDPAGAIRAIHRFRPRYGKPCFGLPWRQSSQSPKGNGFVSPDKTMLACSGLTTCMHVIYIYIYMHTIIIHKMPAQLKHQLSTCSCPQRCSNFLPSCLHYHALSISCNVPMHASMIHFSWRISKWFVVHGLPDILQQPVHLLPRFFSAVNSINLSACRGPGQ